VCSVVWTQGCPLRCPWCHNPELRPPDGGTDMGPSEVAGEIERYADYLDAVIVSGGEPLAQPIDELRELCRLIRRMDLSPVLDTSGYPAERLDRVADSFDRVALDLKAPLRDEAYLRATGDVMDAAELRRAVQAVRGRAELELRITAHPYLPDDCEPLIESVKEIDPDYVVVQRYVGKDGKESGPDPNELASVLEEEVAVTVFVRV